MTNNGVDHKFVKMKQRVSREDAVNLLNQLRKQTDADRKANRHIYNYCCGGGDSNYEANVGLDDMFKGLSFKINFLQSFLVERILTKCATLVGLFMKDYGKLMDATVEEIQCSISFLNHTFDNLRDMVGALTSEKNLYADKALSLAKGFVSASNYSYDMEKIQPKFECIDIISDICFKSGADIAHVLNVMCNGLKSDDNVESIPIITRHETSPSSANFEGSTGRNFTYIENMYNQKLLRLLTEDVHRAVNLSKISQTDNEDIRVDNGDLTVKIECSLSYKTTVSSDESNLLEASFNNRERSALSIQSFVKRHWIRQWRNKQDRLHIIIKFLSRAIFRRRINCRISHKRNIAQCAKVICDTIYNYFSRCKQRDEAAKIIRSNMRIIFRNYQFREISAATRQGARLLIQREWNLRYNDIELRLSKIEAFLGARIINNTDDPIHKPVPINSWNNLSNFSKEDLLHNNLQILNLQRQDEERHCTATIKESLENCENIRKLCDIEASARMRRVDIYQENTLPTTVKQVKRKQSNRKSNFRSNTSNKTNGNTPSKSNRNSAIETMNFDTDQPEDNFSKKHSQGTFGEGDKAESSCSNLPIEFDKASLMSRIEFIKKSL